MNKELNVWGTFFGLSSTSVILEGSTMGLGLRRFSIRLCHWVGRPTKHPCLASNEVWTRCSKFFGADISGLFFFFLRNILRVTRGTACPLQNVPVEISIEALIHCTQHTPCDQVTVILTFQYKQISSAPVIKKMTEIYSLIYSLTTWEKIFKWII